MADTSRRASWFRHRGAGAVLFGIAALVVGSILRMLATRGELWIDELWSLLHVSTITNPVEIFTKVKHDNNHLLNSLWMWACVQLGAPSSLNVRLPSLVCGLLLLYAILRQTRSNDEKAANIVWLGLVAFSYPIMLYGTEARGYSLSLLCALLGYLSLVRLLRDPDDDRAIKIFGLVGVMGCLSHAIYVLFLAPAFLWVVWRVSSSPLKDNSRSVLRYGLAPPILTAGILTLTFYTGMEIGGAPLLPYLEVAATTISVAFGGGALSSVNADVTGWSLFLVVSIVTVSCIELIAWIRSGDPRAILIALILATPWVAVAVSQPHFILPRYFIIQLLFAYLLVARFLVRLMNQGKFGTIVCATLVAAYLAGNTLHTYQLISRGRSHFVEIFTALRKNSGNIPVSVGGDQDYQNALRMAYAGMTPHDINYVNDYLTSTESPHFIIRESIEPYEVFPDTFRTPQGTRYQKVKSYRAPLLNGSNVCIYEIAP